MLSGRDDSDECQTPSEVNLNLGLIYLSLYQIKKSHGDYTHETHSEYIKMSKEKSIFS